MQTKDIVESLKKKPVLKTAFSESNDKYIISIAKNRMLCSIEVSTRLSTLPKKAKMYVDILNTAQPMFKYTIKDNNLKCSSTVWIDATITNKSYADMLSLVISQIKSAKMIFEVDYEKRS